MRMAKYSAGVERAENARARGFGLGDLPERCIARILAFTTPRDVCRLTAVSHLFQGAANSETVWEEMLPHNHRNILSRALNPIVFDSKRDLYFRLCDSILIDAGAKRVWLERSTGKVCYMLSANELTVTWIDNSRAYPWIYREDFRFRELEKLRKMCWFEEVKGRIACGELSPNTVYTVSFVLKCDYENQLDGLNGAALKFYVTAQYGECQRSREREAPANGRVLRVNLTDEEARGRLVEVGKYAAATPRNGNNGWKEFVVGDLGVGGGDEGAYVEFGMDEVDGGRRQLGILVYGVKIEPKQS